MRIQLLVLASLTACGGGGGPTHWKDQPLETVTGTFQGVSYTIELPTGMKKSTISTHADEYSYHAKRGDEDYVFAPSLSVAKTDKKHTLADATKYEKGPILDKQETPDGFVFVTENDSAKGKEDYILQGEKYVGDGALTCNARVYPMTKGESVKDLIPRVEKMCLSIAAKK